MFFRLARFSQLLPLLGLLLFSGIPVMAQEESPEEKQYREDYERTQKIIAIPDMTKRADQLFAFLKERPDSKLDSYAQAHYLQVIESFSKAEKFSAAVQLSERFIKLRPRVGEAYYFYGAALKNQQRYPEALDALAKASVIKSTASRKAREFLEFVYKSQNKGSLVGLDKLLKKAQDEVGK